MGKVTAKYQITIPPEIRKELGIVPGMLVDIIKEGDKYVLHVNSLAILKKKWKGKFKNGVTSDEYLETVRGKIE